MTGLEGNGPNCGQVDSPRDAFEAIIGDLLVGDALGFGGLLDGSRDQIAAFLTTGDDDSCFEWVESPASDENPFEVTCHLEPFGRDRVGTDGTGDLRHIDHSDQAPHQGLGPDSRVLTDGGHQVDIHKVVVHRRGNEPPKGKRPTAPYRVDLDTFSASTGGRGSVELGLSYEIEDQTAQLVAVAPANDDALEPAHLPSIGAGNEFVADLPFVQEVESFVGGADEVGEANELVTDGGETVSGLECAHCGHEHPDDYLDEGPPRCDKCGAYGEPSVRDVLSDGGKDLESASTVHLLRQAAQLIREVRERPTSPTNDPEVSVDAALAKSEFTIRGIAAAAEEGAGYIDGDIDTSLITDGGLPESFDEFADPRSDRDPVCDGCGDRVAREYMDGGFCIGCRLRGRDEELVTDGGVVTKEYLDAILRKESTTPLDERRRCPDCEQANLAPRKPDTFASTKPRAKWYCGTCCEPVEEPLEPGDEDYPELQTDGGTDRAWGQIPDGEVREAIEQLVDERGPYFNACDLAPKLGISPHAAGHLLGSRDDVEAWGYSRNATTWHYVGADRELVSDGGRD